VFVPGRKLKSGLCIFADPFHAQTATLKEVKFFFRSL